MPSRAISAIGMKLRSNRTGFGLFTYGEINRITGPSPTRDFVDVTTVSSIGGFREVIAGFRDGGTLTMNMNFTPAGYERLAAEFGSPDAFAYVISFEQFVTARNYVGAPSITFNGLVTDFPLSVSVDEAIKVDVTVKISGTLTYSPGIPENLYEVVSPQTGDKLQPNVTHVIQWLTPLTPSRIEFSSNGGVDWSDVIASEPGGSSNARHYVWTTPNIVTQEARLRISAVGAPANFDETGDFWIG